MSNREIHLSLSRKSMMQNEEAFPGEAVNTIAVRMYFPQCGAQSVCRAVDQVTEHTGVFRLQLTKDAAGALVLTDSGECAAFCMSEDRKTRREAEEFCRRLEAEPFRGFPDCGLWEARAIPVLEGGTLLSLRFHHVLVDGYSMCQTAQRILDALGGEETEEIPLGEERAEQNFDPEEEKKFWLEYFRDAEFESSILPGQAEGCRRTCYTREISEELGRQIDRFAAEQNLTPAAVFSGALSVYLAGAEQCRDAVFLMPRLNRNSQEEREAFGCQTLVVPVRVPVEERDRFSNLCRRALSRSRSASEHKQYGMGKILGDLQREGICGSSVSEYTLNIYQPVLRGKIPFEIRLSMDGAMHNHLTLNITRLQGKYTICYDGRDGIYGERQVERVHQAFAEILRRGTGEDPQVRELPLTAPEEEALLRSVQGPQVPFDPCDTIPSLFRRAVEKYGKAPALYAGENSLTYEELDRLSNRVANGLLERGIGSGCRVLYLLNRDIRLIPVMLGISKAGAAFIPVDPQYPRERIDYIFENSQAACLISSANVEGAERFSYVEAEELLACRKTCDPQIPVSQEQLAYCIYTSGTTGRPKGVMLSHRGIVNITRPENNPFNRDICRNCRGIVAIGSVCFDISLFEIFVPLLNGRFVEFAPERAMADPEALSWLIRAHGADILHCTPSRLTAYLHNRHFVEALEGVHAVLAAGEILPSALADELDHMGIRIYNGYGPTETTIGATITEAGDNETIGRPIANMGVMILGRRGELLPLSAAGEICVWGAGVGIGYHGLPEQTAEKFTILQGRRVYRTGDVGQFTEDGRILYRGRNDSQVKLRGLRLELSEIENRIREQPAVGAVHVLVRSISGSQHLAAFYTVKEGLAVTAETLKAALRESLPLYMVPDVWKELPEMPQTPGGKTDFGALQREPVEYVRNYRAPSGRTEEAIAEAYEKVLEVSPVGAEDSFFELGGDSLHISEVICEIEERLPGVSIDFSDVFSYPTPELLAQHLKAPEEKEKETSLHHLDYRGIRELLSGNRPGSGSRKNLGNILLTGVTGFLGIHILTELLKHPDSWNRIWCLVRPNQRLSAEKRLRSTLFYYSEDDYSSLFGERLLVADGDITDEQAFRKGLGEKIDLVINSAANVAHFAADDRLEKTNTGGVKNLLRFCQREAAALVQISTVSVGGIYPRDGEPLLLTERDLYVGQEIRNQYILSKYMAEYEALRAAADRGIPVKIMRVGNLQGRISDGEFQMNNRTNAFTRQLASYVKIGAAPASLYRGSVNFSPVDETARILVKLAALRTETAVYHVCPPEEVPYRKIFQVLERFGHPVEAESDSRFEQRLAELSRTREGRTLTEGILLERPNMAYRDTAVSEELTAAVLAAMGEKWQPVTEAYLEKYIAALDDLFMFE